LALLQRKRYQTVLKMIASIVVSKARTSAMMWSHRESEFFSAVEDAF